MIIKESLKKFNIILNKKGRVFVDDDKCVDCGACISLCPTDALCFDEENRLKLYYDRCIGCLLCLNSCPRFAIEEM
jgi:Pyruvate/2-oxoacid:ferredoxin oxidoreductase delta subunit